MSRSPRDADSTGIALTAAAGFAVGLVTGLVAGEWFGDVHSDRVRGVVRRLRGRRAEPPEPPDARDLQTAVRDALRRTGATRRLDLTVHTPGDGLVELIGTAPDAVSRRTAGEVARAVRGADVVVNRILVEGSDLPPKNRTG